MENEMNVLVVEPGRKPYEKTIPKGLESLQKEVGGYIEAVYPYDEPVALIMNEEGKLRGLSLNRALRGDDGEIYDIIAGKFLVAGLGEEDFCSLSEELKKQFAKKFEAPEMFLRMKDGKIMALPIQDKKDSVISKLENMKTEPKTPSKPHIDKEAR